MRTGIEAWKTAKGLYIITALIAFTGLVGGDWFASLHIAGFAVFAIYGSVCLLKGYSEGALPLPLYIAMGAGTILCFIPQALVWNSIGAFVIIAVTIITKRNKAKAE